MIANTTTLPEKWRRILRPLLLLLVLYFLWALSDLLYVSIGVEADHAAPADAIIVLGCPSYEQNILADHYSACVQVRAHHAADLYRRGLAANIIPSGGLTGPAPSEAEAMAQVMEADGVPRSAIVVEDQAHDTIGNIRYCRAIMREHGWRTAILVTEPHHIRRAELIARDAGLTVFVSPANASPSWHYPPAQFQNLWQNAHFLMDYQVARLFGLSI